MDDLDRKILKTLAADGRTPYSRIAEEAGVATTTVHQRVKKLTENGIIRGTRVIVDWEAIGLPVTAVVSVEAPEARPLADIADQMRSISEYLMSIRSTCRRPSFVNPIQCEPGNCFTMGDVSMAVVVEDNALAVLRHCE